MLLIVIVFIVLGIDREGVGYMDLCLNSGSDERLKTRTAPSTHALNVILPIPNTPGDVVRIFILL